MANLEVSMEVSRGCKNFALERGLHYTFLAPTGRFVGVLTWRSRGGVLTWRSRGGGANLGVTLYDICFNCAEACVRSLRPEGRAAAVRPAGHGVPF